MQTQRHATGKALFSFRWGQSGVQQIPRPNTQSVRNVVEHFQGKGPHDVGGLDGTQVGTADLRLLRQLLLGHPLHFSQAGDHQAKFDEPVPIAEFHFLLAHPRHPPVIRMPIL